MGKQGYTRVYRGILWYTGVYWGIQGYEGIYRGMKYERMLQTFITYYYFYYMYLRVDVRSNQTKFRISGKPFWNIDFTHTFNLESAMSLGNYGMVHLVKYCFILEKNANYRTPLKRSIRRAIFGFTLVIGCGKLKRLSPKITFCSN